MCRYLAFLIIVAMTSHVFASPLMVGAAKIEITPKQPVVLAGYGGRTKPHEKVETKLWARAMVIGQTRPVAVVAVDNCGMTAAHVQQVIKKLKGKVSGERLVVSVTHTHNAPNLTGYAPILWAGRMSESQKKATDDYTQFVVQQVEVAVTKALQSRVPMTLHWAQGRVDFGRNRRVIQSGKWSGFGNQQSGPVDHSLPVMVAKDAQGVVRMVWTNYACHCTTIGGANSIAGDWAGYANNAIESNYPHSISLVTIGCGADVGPQPSGGLEIANRHGKTIAAEVKRVVAGNMTPLNQAPHVQTRQIKLKLADPGTKESWTKQLSAGGFYRQQAIYLLKKLEEEGTLPAHVPYPISVWRFSDDLAVVFLAGEVVVDYAVRLKHELDWERLWINGWCNDMPGYIPSRRVLAEGGYEADFSQVYYGQPGRYAPEIEDHIVKSVSELVGRSFSARRAQKPSPYHRPPSMEETTFKEFKRRRSTLDDASRKVLSRFKKLLERAEPGVAKITLNQGETTAWFNYAGDHTQRAFIRQRKVGTRLEWSVPATRSKGERILFFSGGVGWESQQKTAGFTLELNGQNSVAFDVTRNPAQWLSQDGNLELVYLPIWRSDVDSAGFFLLRMKKSAIPSSDLVVRVVSKGEKSLRWFALDAKQDFKVRSDKLKRLLQ